MENTQGAERVLTKAIEIAADRYGISSDFQHVVFAALYLRRYLDAVKFEDDDAKRYCKRKLEDLNRLRVLGLSRYHLYILGLYLDIHEATGEYPFIGPIAVARKLGRNVVGRFNRGMEEQRRG